MIPALLKDMTPSTYFRTISTHDFDSFTPVMYLVDRMGKVWVFAIDYHGGSSEDNMYEFRVFDLNGVTRSTWWGGSGCNLATTYGRFATFGEWFYFVDHRYTSSPCTFRLRLLAYNPRTGTTVALRTLSGTNWANLISPTQDAAGAISICPKTKRGVYSIEFLMQGVFYNGWWAAECGWFSVPEIWSDSSPAYIGNGYSDSDTSEGPGNLASSYFMAAAHDGKATVEYMNVSGTWYYRSIADLLSPSMSTLTSGTSTAGRNYWEAGPVHSRGANPSLLYNWNETVSWDMSFEPPTWPGFCFAVYLGEDTTYYYVALQTDHDAWKIVALLKSGTTSYTLESFSESYNFESLVADRQWPGRVALLQPHSAFLPAPLHGSCRILTLPILEAT